MEPRDSRRPYYDHEAAYRQIAAKGGVGWDALAGSASGDSYAAIEAFLASPFASSLGAGRTALELGCGGGQVAMMFARRGCESHGVDFSPTAISLAKRNATAAGLAVDFRAGDCLTLAGYDDRSMDVVADNHVWHCIVGAADRQSFLRAAHRVLKPGGLLFSETMTREGNFDPSVVQADPSTFVSKHHNRYWPARAEALGELRSAGFETVHEHLKPQPHEPGVGDLLLTYSRRAE